MLRRMLLLLAVYFMCISCAVGNRINARVCATVKEYGRVCAYWQDGKIVLEAEVAIPEDRVDSVLNELGVK